MAKALYLDSVAGVAGDMFSAAFVDAGLVTGEELNGLAVKLGLNGVRVETETVIRATIAATKLNVVIEDESWTSVFSTNGHHHHHHHNHEHHHHHHETSNLVLDGHASHWHVHYPKIDDLLAASSLDDSSKELARRIYFVIAEAEAGVHGVAVEKAAFHEVGAADSIMDVVMAAYCITKVRAEKYFATPIKPGRGSIKIAHGTHSVPPPASAKLLWGMHVNAVPDAISAKNIELSTPTGIAILRVLEPEFVNEIPGGKFLYTGRGSGTMDLGDYPNIFQVTVIETSESTDVYARDEVIEISFNIDDDTGEHMAWIAKQLLELGSLDVWQAQATGKKGRVMTIFSVLVKKADLNKTADWILKNSTTFGLRYREWDRLKLDVEFEERGGVRYKVGRDRPGNKLKEKPEFDDLASNILGR